MTAQRKIFVCVLIFILSTICFYGIFVLVEIHETNKYDSNHHIRNLQTSIGCSVLTLFYPLYRLWVKKQ